MSGRELVMMLGFGTFAFMLIVLLLERVKRATNERMRRLDLLAEGLRAPDLDPATRAELLRSLTRQQGIVAWAWQRLQNPMVWRVLWFGSGWLLFVMGSAVFAMWACGLAHGVDHMSVLMIGVTGFAMLTMPLALRELLRRDRVAADGS